MLTGYKWTETPISDSIIALIHELAANQPEGITFGDDDDFAGVEDTNENKENVNNNYEMERYEELPGVLIPEEEEKEDDDESSDSNSSKGSITEHQDDNDKVNENTKVITTQELKTNLLSNLDEELEEIKEIDEKISTKIEAYEENMDAEEIDDEITETKPPLRSTKNRKVTDRFTPSLQNKSYAD